MKKNSGVEIHKLQIIACTGVGKKKRRNGVQEDARHEGEDGKISDVEASLRKGSPLSKPRT